MEEPIGSAAVPEKQLANGKGSGTLSPDGNLLRVAAKRRNVLLHPRQRLTHITQREIGVARSLDPVGIHEAPSCLSVVDRYGEDGAADVNGALHDEAEVVPVPARRADLITPAMDVKHDRELLSLGTRRANDIDAQAVLRYAVLIVSIKSVARTRMAVLLRTSDV